MGGGQPQPGAALFFRIERLEDLFPLLGGDARPVVLYLNFDPAADISADRTLNHRRRPVDMAGGEGQHAAFRHGLNRVQA